MLTIIARTRRGEPGDEAIYMYLNLHCPETVIHLLWCYIQASCLALWYHIIYVVSPCHTSVCLSFSTVSTTDPSLSQVVSEGFSEEVQWHALSLLRLAAQHSLQAQLEFEALEGIGLVQQVMRTPQAAVGRRIADVSWRTRSVL